MADAINRAGSTDAGQDPGRAQGHRPQGHQVVTGYNGVKFDEKGQNVLASSLLIQMQGGNTCRSGRRTRPRRR